MTNKVIEKKSRRNNWGDGQEKNWENTWKMTGNNNWEDGWEECL